MFFPLSNTPFNQQIFSCLFFSVDIRVSQVPQIPDKLPFRILCGYIYINFKLPFKILCVYISEMKAANSQAPLSLSAQKKEFPLPGVNY